MKSAICTRASASRGLKWTARWHSDSARLQSQSYRMCTVANALCAATIVSSNSNAFVAAAFAFGKMFLRRRHPEDADKEVRLREPRISLREPRIELNRPPK